MGGSSNECGGKVPRGGRSRRRTEWDGAGPIWRKKATPTSDSG
jgi:hypothetical protein